MEPRDLPERPDEQTSTRPPRPGSADDLVPRRRPAGAGTACCLGVRPPRPTRGGPAGVVVGESDLGTILLDGRDHP